MKIVAVSFKGKNKEYYFKMEKELRIKENDYVVVETVRGLELAIVRNSDVQNTNIPVENMMPLIRKATPKDLKTHEENIQLAKEAFTTFNQCLKEFPGLDMSLIETEYNLDRTKLLFMYVSDERVDFRELLKVLASHFKTRIELKQIGARDKAKMVGGLGPCGMEICCSRFLKEFDNISINMAKNQMISLNPIKISGLCGRLLCCLKYENEMYSQMKKTFPKIGSFVTFEKGKYRVTGLNLLMDQVKIESEGVFKFVDKKDVKW